MKRWIAALCALALLVTGIFSLPACSVGMDLKDPDDYVPGDVAPEISATLRVAMLNTTQEEELMDELAAGFNVIYPNVDFESTKLTTYESGIAQTIATGTNLDVIWVPDAYVTSLADQGLLYNLEKYMEKSEKDGLFDPDDYQPAMMQLGQYKHGSDPENTAQYFLPRDYSKIVTYINTALVEKYAPEFDVQYYVEHMDEWTWDVMLDLCGQLQKGMANEQTKPRIVEAMWRWLILFYGLVRAEDGVYLDASGSAVLDEGFQNALNLVRDLIDKGYTTFDTNLTELNRFHSAQSVIAFQSRPYLATAVVLEDDLEILPFPAIGDDPKVGTGTTGYGICTSSENPDLAWEFIRYMMSANGQTVLSETGKAVPSMISLQTGENPGWKQFYSQYNYNHDAFVFAPERDVVMDYYDMLTSAAAKTHDDALRALFEAYWKSEGSASLIDVIDRYKTATR